MIPCIAFAGFLSVLFATTGAVAACPPDQAKSHPAKTSKDRGPAQNCVDLSTVPQISAQIVAGTPAAPPAKPEGYGETPPYEGPTLGLTKPEPGVMPAPTLGYKWSLK